MIDHVHGLEGSTWWRCQFSTFMWRFNIIPIKISARYLVDRGKIILQSIWKSKETEEIKAILKKRDKLRRISLPDFKTYYTATNNQECAVLVKEKTQWLIEDSREPRHRPTQMCSPQFWQKLKGSNSRDDRLCWSWSKWHPSAKANQTKQNLTVCLIPYIKISSSGS